MNVGTSGEFDINASKQTEEIYLKGPFIASHGTPGMRGERGDRGERGPQGKQGRVGKIGPKGPAGFRGLQGPRGFLVGPIGLNGVEGNEGPTGPQGTQGMAGSTGAFGPTGSAQKTLFNPLRPIVWDEFISGNSTSQTIGGLGWTLLTGEVSTSLPPGPLANHPGVIELIAPGPTGPIGDFESLLQLSDTVGSVYLPDPFDLKMIVRVNTDTQTSYGFFSEDLTTFVAFVSDLTPGFWSIQWNDGTLKTQTTTVPVTTDWVQLRMLRSVPNGDVQFYINNTPIFNLLAAEVPSEALNLTIGSAASTDGGAVDIDYVSLSWPALTR